MHLLIIQKPQIYFLVFPGCVCSCLLVCVFTKWLGSRWSDRAQPGTMENHCQSDNTDLNRPRVWHIRQLCVCLMSSFHDKRAMKNCTKSPILYMYKNKKRGRGGGENENSNHCINALGFPLWVLLLIDIPVFLLPTVWSILCETQESHMVFVYLCKKDSLMKRPRREPDNPRGHFKNLA